LSRDLRELAVVKGPEGYRVPPPGSAGSGRLQAMARDLGARVRSIDVGGTIVVLRTDHPEDATVLARRFDASQLPRVVAAVANDRTVLVITRSTTDAAEIAREWRGASRLP
jgi:arginine repressor